MRALPRCLYVALLFALLCLSPLPAASAPARVAPMVDPDLWRALATPDTAPLRVIAVLRTPNEHATFRTELAPAQARALYVLRAQSAYAAALAPLEPVLAQAEAQGQLTARRDLWLINSVALTAQTDLVHELLKSPAIAELRLDQYRQYLDAPSTAPLTTTPNTPWHIDLVRAPEVWNTLGITGAGVVVAGMDTGADWLHPALNSNYRGNLSHGWVDHSAAWFDAVNGGIYPYDDYGHGTHILGTAVGQSGIGVAPGARWIAVKVFSSDGYAYDSWLHAGFQWLLAPGGNPALAPDLVNCSWGNRNATLTTFQADIALLQAAGIHPIFAAGNNGSGARTLTSPGSLPGVVAVGATDVNDDVTYFSGRGPSPWGEIKPYLSAPGANVLSAVPGGVYQQWNGTSMATPHVTGAAALVRAADPTLPWVEVTRILTQTVVPLGSPIPNNDSGWGRLDVYEAVVVAAHPGWITGNVQGSDNQPLPWAVIHAEPYSGSDGRPVTRQAGPGGAYSLAVVPAPYDVTASAFGYTPVIRPALALTNTVVSLDFTLPKLPTGILVGRVTVAPTGDVPTLPVTVRALATPVTTTLDAAGNYALTLPTGIYTVEMRGNGYRVITAAVTVTAGSTATQDFTLRRAPTLLLIDQGTVAFQLHTHYWRAALDALQYAYDEHLIKSSSQTLLTTTLRAYEAVVWSAPVGSPALLGTGAALEDYLDQGGRLLLSGQDVAFFDSGAYLYIPAEAYFYDRLSARFLADDAPSRELVGRGPFAGLTFSITGGDGADNQDFPDEVGVLDAGKSELLFTYTGGRGGGVGASICTPYRAALFSFGFEAISTAAMRVAVLERALDWLTTPPLSSGLTLDTPVTERIGLPGDTLTYTLRLRHIGMAGSLEAFTVSLDGHTWPSSITPPAAHIAPCETFTLTLAVTIPPAASVNSSDAVTVTITAEQSAPVMLTLRTKTPAPVLLIDDDRWYPMEERYFAALDARNIPYDTWSTHHQIDGPPIVYSVTAQTLDYYPLVVWFTGYDWYQPIHPDEAAALLAYLDAGGRVLLTSQDFLYYHAHTALAERLGVLWGTDYPVKSTQGIPEHPLGWPRALTPLIYPFQNWSDLVEPTPAATISARGQDGQPVAVAAEHAPSRTLFYGFPLETLPLAARANVLEAGVGWLSPLGLSRWEVAPSVPLPGAAVTFTLALHYDGATSAPVVFSHTLPVALTLLPATLPPALSYDPLARRIAWQGVINPQQTLTFTWAVVVSDSLAPGTELLPRVALSLPAWGLTFHREARLQVAGADLSASRWLTPELGRVGEPLTLTLWLHNAGPGTVYSGTVDVWLMPYLSPLTATVAPTQGTALAAWWTGALAPEESRPLTLTLRAWTWQLPLRVDALLADGTGQRWERSQWVAIPPWEVYLPLVLRRP